MVRTVLIVLFLCRKPLWKRRSLPQKEAREPLLQLKKTGTPEFPRVHIHESRDLCPETSRISTSLRPRTHAPSLSSNLELRPESPEGRWLGQPLLVLMMPTQPPLQPPPRPRSLLVEQLQVEALEVVVEVIHALPTKPRQFLNVEVVVDLHRHRRQPTVLPSVLISYLYWFSTTSSPFLVRALSSW